MTTSKHEISIEKVVSVIKGLTLSGISSENILNQARGNEKEFKSLPGVSVSENGVESYDPADGDTQTTVTGYPVLIAIIDEQGNNEASKDARKLWRETIRNALQHKKWSGAVYDGQYDTRMEMGPIVDGVSYEKLTLWISLMTCRVFWRELHT